MTSAVYGDVTAEYWDLLVGPIAEWTSRRYFLELLAAETGPALYVGCGTGHLLIDLARSGIEIHGVDNSAAMLAQCRKNAAETGQRLFLFEQCMEHLDLPYRYQTIIVPASSFQHLISGDVAHAALRRFHEHLLPGGGVYLSLRTIEPSARDGDWNVVATGNRPADGAIVRKWFRCWNDAAARLQHAQIRYEVSLASETRTIAETAAGPYLRWYTTAGAVALVERAGFRQVGLAPDTAHGSAGASSTEFVVTGRRGTGSSAADRASPVAPRSEAFPSTPAK